MTKAALTAVWLALAAAALSASSRSASASALYYEGGGGLATFSQTAPFFGSTAGSTGVGYSLDNALMMTFGGAGRGLAFQLGVQYRISASSDSVNNYGLEALYPSIRIQLARLYIGAGYTPYVWRRINPQAGLDYFSRAESTDAILGEAGLLMPVTRKFSLGTSVSAQFISASGTESPKPALNATVFLRIYFGFFGSGGGGGGSGDESSGEYLGRYPFGAIR